MSIRVLTLTASVALAAAYSVSLPAANYFKCVGPDGGVIFSDTECPETSEVVTEKTLKAGTLSGVVGADPYQDTEHNMSLEHMLNMRGRLTEVLNAISPVKTAAAEYHLSEQSWAPHLEALGFNSRRMNSSQIEQIQLGREGAIIARLRKAFGDGKLVVLTPREVLDGTQLEWDCAANFSPLIMESLPCESRRIHE